MYLYVNPQILVWCVLFSPTSVFIPGLGYFRICPDLFRNFFPIKTDLLSNPRPSVAQQCNQYLDEKLQINALLGENYRRKCCGWGWTNKTHKETFMLFIWRSLLEPLLKEDSLKSKKDVEDFWSGGWLTSAGRHKKWQSPIKSASCDNQ